MRTRRRLRRADLSCWLSVSTDLQMHSYVLCIQVHKRLPPVSRVTAPTGTETLALHCRQRALPEPLKEKRMDTKCVAVLQQGAVVKRLTGNRESALSK
jgi:hypothetical protein